uniref:MIT domain-containing protein n=1 Tax=Plectus sambesii TaxID=2011161 RepID=A0A914X4V6_9BILA
NHVETIKLITEAVELYLPALQLIEDELERQRMRTKVQGYLRRAEHLKKALRPDARAPDSARSSPDKLDLLEELWSDTPQVRASILVATKAEELETGENWSAALDKYQLAIEAMLQVLNREPLGRRKDVLRNRVERWLRRAEQLQLYVDVSKLNLSRVAETEKAEAALEEDTEKLAKQQQCFVQ